MKILMIIGIFELCFLVLRLIIGAIKEINGNSHGMIKLVNTVETVVVILTLSVLIASYYNV